MPLYFVHANDGTDEKVIVDASGSMQARLIAMQLLGRSFSGVTRATQGDIDTGNFTVIDSDQNISPPGQSDGTVTNDVITPEVPSGSGFFSQPQVQDFTTQFRTALQNANINPFGSAAQALFNPSQSAAQALFLGQSALGNANFQGNNPFTQFLQGTPNLFQGGANAFQSILNSSPDNQTVNQFRDPIEGSNADLVTRGLARLALGNRTNRSFDQIFGNQLVNAVRDRFNLSQQQNPAGAGTFAQALNRQLNLGF